MMNPMAGMYPKPMPVSAGKVYPADQPMVNMRKSAQIQSNEYF